MNNAGRCLTMAMLVISFTACGGRIPEQNTNIATQENTAARTGTNDRDTPVYGKVIDRVVCKSDTSQSYAVYIPVMGRGKALPVIFLFDPHGDGPLPVHKYSSLAGKYGFILVGSNNSKNGNDWPATAYIGNILFSEIQSRFNIDRNRIYTCGFSGGAKVAGFIALRHNDVKGVIANGAGLPDEVRPGNFNFSFTAIAGKGDMNMTGLAAFNAGLDKTQTRHRMIFFDGIHEWAPENTMDIAFTALQMDAMRDRLIPADALLITRYRKESQKRISEYIGSNNLIKAEEECRLSLNMLEGLAAGVDWFKEKEAWLISGITYKKQLQEQQNLFTKEENFKTAYKQRFEQVDRRYWDDAINDLRRNAKAKTAESAMYQRLLAYLSLAFYSISNRLITAGENAEAAYFVDLYKLADPANSEAWYFSAILNARSGNSGAAKEDLLKAVTLGFTDEARLLQQPEFSNPAAPLDLQPIVRKMKRSNP